MSRALAILCAITLAGCEAITVDGPKIAAPDIQAAPLPVAPILSPVVQGGLVCLTPDDALLMAEHVTVDWPAWAAKETARAELYRELVVGEPE